MKLTLSFLVVTMLAFGQSQSRQYEDRTSGLFNGRFWLQLSQDQRNTYVFGMLDQLQASENDELVAMMKISRSAKQITNGPIFAQISRIITGTAKASIPDMSALNPAAIPGGIDEFYSNPDNRIVPIVEALRFWVKKEQGEDATQLTKEIADRAAHWRKPGSGLNGEPLAVK